MISLFVCLQLALFVFAIGSSYTNFNRFYYNEKYLSFFHMAFERSATIEYLFKEDHLQFEDFATVADRQLHWSIADEEEIYNFFVITRNLQILLRTEKNSKFYLTKQTFDFLRHNLNVFVPIYDKDSNVYIAILRPIYLQNEIFYIFLSVPVDSKLSIFDFFLINGAIYFIILFILIIPIEIYLSFRFITFFEKEAASTKDQTNEILMLLTNYVKTNTTNSQEKLRM